jgi:4-carboxymuconolactone decarboxylase
MKTELDQESARQDEKANRRTSEDDAKVMAAISKRMGHVPAPLPLVAKRPGAAATLWAHKNQVMEGGPLSEKERSLIALSSAAALKSTECVRSHAQAARKAGASEEEVIQTVLIAGYVSGMSPLRAAYDVFCDE